MPKMAEIESLKGPSNRPLTSGVDTSGELKGSAGTTSTAGNDTIVATVATMQSLDAINGGAGTDKLSIVETGSVAKLAGTFTGIETVVVQSGGSIGAAAANAAVAQAQKVTYTFGSTGTPYAVGDKVTVTVGANTTVLTIAATGITTATIEADIKDVIEAEMDKAYGAGSYAAISGGVITVTAGTAGVALPSISISSDNDDFAVTPATVQKNVVAAGAIDAATFGVFSSATEVTATAVKEIVLSAGADDKVTATAGTTVSVTGGKDVTASGTGGVTVDGAAGAVVVTEKGAGNVVVTAGDTVSVVKSGASISAFGSATARAGNITVGADAAFGSNPFSATGFPQIDLGDGQPTGNVTINNSTNYTTLLGQTSRAFGSGSATVYTNGATNVSVATGGAVTVKDVQVATRINAAGEVAKAGTSTLATVRIEGTNASGTVTSDALTALTLINAGASAAITVSNANLHALALTLGNNTANSSVTDATATSVTVTTEAQSISPATVASASTTTINAANATSLTFNNADAVKLGNSALANLTKLTSVVATGAGKVDIGDITGASKLTSVDASASSGGLVATVGGTGSFGLTLKGSSGADTITLKSGASLAAALVNGANVTTSLTLGAGNDTLLDGGSVTVGAGVTIDAGGGTDTISQTLVNGANAAVFQNFETLEVTGLNTAFDGAAMTTSAIANVALAGAGASTTATTNVAEVRNLATTAATLTIGQYTDQATSSSNVVVSGVKVSLKDATGTSDSLAINYAATVTTNGTNDVSRVGAVTQTGIESVTIASGGSRSLDANYLGQLVDTSNKMSTITITGSKAFTLADVDTNTAATATVATATASSLTLIDGSAATGLLSITAGTSSVVGNVTTSYTGLTIKGGDALTDAAGTAAGDTLTNAATKGVTFGGAGADTINANGSSQTVYGGTQGDTINVNAANATVFVGTDAVNAVDTVVIGGPSPSTTLAGAGAAFTATAASAPTSSFVLAASALTKISDLASGDKIDLSAASSSASVGNLFTSLATDTGSEGVFTAATTLDGLINQAITDATKAIDWFVFQGDTYVVVNGTTLSGSTSGSNLNDYVIHLVGDYTASLTGVSALTSGVLTLG